MSQETTGQNLNLPLTQAKHLLQSQKYLEAKALMLLAVQEQSQKLREVKPSPAQSAVRDTYLKTIQDFNKNRGRDLYYPFIASGLGAGPFVELLDGSVKLDMITGIGINYFGHSHPKLMSEVLDVSFADIQQGNLEPAQEAPALAALLLSKVGKNCNLKHIWLTTCGTMANEIGLKIIRQKKYPATKIIAFNDCFCGRSTALQEITDSPAYRVGQPTYGEVSYVPFYQPELGLDKSVQATLDAMKSHLGRQPGKYAAMMLELVQGEGGFNFAPREYYVRVFEEAKKAGLAIWIDEVQTVGRTGQLFAYQTFGLESYVDVVSVGKMLQACAVFYTEEYNPKPGLVAGTFSGATTALKTAKRIVELLEEEGHLGPDGKTNQLSKRFLTNFKQMAEGDCKGLIRDYRAIGGMIALEPLGGTMEDVKKVLLKLFDLGVVAFYCGHGPYLIRMLPPLAAMTDQDVDQVCKILGQALKESATGSKSS